MKYTRSQTYDRQFLLDNMMGPNAMKMLEELTELPGMLELKPGMRVLDLGCGRGLTSIFLAKEFGVQVFATDLWITASENFARFKEAGIDQRIIPIHADAADLPYADEYFDAIISIDAYHYFGRVEGFVDEKIAPLLKKGGKLAIVVPGLKKTSMTTSLLKCSCHGMRRPLRRCEAPSGGEIFCQSQSDWSFKRLGSWKALENAGTTGCSATMNMLSATGKPWREGLESIWIWFT